MGKEQELRPDLPTFLLWVADSYEALASVSTIPEEIEGFKGSAEMAREHHAALARRSSDEQAEVVGWRYRRRYQNTDGERVWSKWLLMDHRPTGLDAECESERLVRASPVAMGGVTEEMAKTAIAVFLDDPEWDMGLGNGDKIRRMVAALTAALSPPGKGDGQ